MRNGRSSFRSIMAIPNSIRPCPVAITKTLSSKEPGTGISRQITFASSNPFRQRPDRCYKPVVWAEHKDRFG